MGQRPLLCLACERSTCPSTAHVGERQQSGQGHLTVFFWLYVRLYMHMFNVVCIHSSLCYCGCVTHQQANSVRVNFVCVYCLCQEEGWIHFRESFMRSDKDFDFSSLELVTPQRDEMGAASPSSRQGTPMSMSSRKTKAIGNQKLFLFNCLILQVCVYVCFVVMCN